MSALEQAASFSSGQELSVQEWADNRCNAMQGSRLQSKQAYDDYSLWASKTGRRPIGPRMFSLTILRAGVHRLRSNGHSYFVGLRLKEEAPI